MMTIMPNMPLDMPSRAHLPFTVFASAARAEATYNSDDIENRGWRGVILYLDITAETGVATLDVKVQVKDHLSGQYIDMPGAAFAQKTAVGSDTLTIYPGIAETANRSVSDVLPHDWRVVATVGGTTVTLTFTVSAVYLR